MKRIGIVVKADPRARAKADEFERWLRQQGADVLRRESLLPERREPDREKSFAPSDLFCIFVLGGDGTFLSAVRWIGDQNIPILGVKFGEVGFLAETAEDDLFSAARSILRDGFATEARMRLQVEVVRNGAELVSETILNDAVINKGALARLAHIQTAIDGHHLTTYSGDGLIVATPTGSTAYSLAAGGPVIHPAVAGIILTPICPFTLTNRPLIVPDSAIIAIRLAKQASDIMLTFDGQEGMQIFDTDTILIRKSPHPIHMITMPGQQYFDVLKTKLRWSGGRS